MFSKDVSNHRLSPRTLQQSRFGPYARLDVEKPKYGIRAWIWMVGCAISVGATWWICLALRA